MGERFARVGAWVRSYSRFGVPALAGGLAFDAVPFVSAAAWCSFIAALVDTVNVIRILRYAFLTPSSAPL